MTDYYRIPVWVAAGLIALIILFTAVFTRAGEVYYWKTADGVVEFTDDVDRVPAMYKASVTLAQTITDYHKYTSSKNGEYQDSLAGRLEYLRKFNSTRDSEVRVDKGPLVVYTVRVKPDYEEATRQDTLITQNGEVIAEIKGKTLSGPIDQGE